MSKVDKQFFTVFQQKAKEEYARDGLLTFGKYDNNNCKSRTYEFPLLADEWNFKPSVLNIGNTNIISVQVNIQPSNFVNQLPENVFRAVIDEFAARQWSGRYYVDCKKTDIKLNLSTAQNRLSIPADLLVAQVRL